MVESKQSLIKDASVAKSLFMGRILEENLFPFPRIEGGEAETLKMVLESVERFMEGKEAQYREYDRKGEQPEDYIQGLRELGLFGLIIPEEFGGIGLSNASYSRVLQTTSGFDAATSLTIGAHSSIGMKGLLLFGTAEQKQRYLPELASGERIAAFCLTEPGSGSDAASIKTEASKNSDGSWTLNGEKIWITNGSLAGFYTVFARTDSELGKMSAFIVERGWPGVSNGPKEDKLGIRASATTTVNFANVRVPPENLLGAEGHGFKVAMSILNNGRTGLGGGCVGAMKRCIQLAVKQASERKQFGRPIAEFELIKEKIAQMTVRCFAAESAVQMVAHYIDSGVDDYSIEAAISKIYASEALWYVAYEALQIAGGNGFMKEYPYEKVVRDSRINMIFEGTNEILRLYVALSGLKVVGESLKELKESAASIFNDPIKGFGVLSRYAAKRISGWSGFGRDTIDAVHPALEHEAVILETYAQRLGKASDALLMKLGKHIIGHQYQSKRIAEVAIDLFVGACVLSRVSRYLEERGEEKCKLEIDLAKLYIDGAKHRMNSSIRALAHNADEVQTSVAETILKNGAYPWDIV